MMDKWEKFICTGDIRDYLAYKAAAPLSGGMGLDEKHEQSDLYRDRYRFVCRAGRGI